jgi:hypothetical protein
VAKKKERKHIDIIILSKLHGKGELKVANEIKVANNIILK